MNNQDQLLIEAANILRSVDENTIDNAKARYKVTGSSRDVDKRLKQLKKLAKTDPATAIKEYDKALSELKALRKQADKIENDSRALIILVDEAKFLAGAAASLLFLKGVQKATKANSLDLLEKAMTHDEDSKEYADAMRSMQTRAYMRNYSRQVGRAVTIGETIRAAYSSICAIKSAIKGETTDRNRKSALEAVDKVIAACEKAKREAARKLNATKSSPQKDPSANDSEANIVEAAHILNTYCGNAEAMNEATLIERYKSISTLRSAAKEFNDRVKHAESDKHLKFACNEFKKKLAAAKKDVEKMSDNDVARYVAKYVARVGMSMIAAAIGISISMRMVGMGANSQIAKIFRSVAAPAAGANAAIGTTIGAIADTISGNGTTKKECLNLIDKMSATCDQIASLGIENLKKAKKLARKLKRESKGHHAVDIY